MDDTLFMALAKDAVGYVDDRFGRIAAWFCAALLVVLPVAFIWLAVLWLT